MIKTYLALEVSDQKIRHLIIEKSGSTIAMKRAGVSNFKLDPSAPGALTHFVQEIIAQENLDVARIFLTINRQDTVIHQMTLAKMSKTDLDVVVHGEIEKIPIFFEK